MDPVALSIFSNRIEAVCDEMGAALRRAAFSPNIRDRLDYSCAVFDPLGGLVAQAAHIPVHLGSMAYAMRSIVETIDWQPGDMIILNDPFQGGTHLPDVSLIAPIYYCGKLMGYVANRAHHADIGAETPGSMPLSSSIEEEGVIIQPMKLVKRGELDSDALESIIGRLRNRTSSMGDFTAQVAANRTGLVRLEELISALGVDGYADSVGALNRYAEQLSREAFRRLPDGRYHFEDFLEEDGLGRKDIAIRAVIEVNDGLIHVDFDGTSAQVPGNVNCPLSVTAAGVYYVFRCLLPPQTPACAGSFRCIEITAPAGSLVDAVSPAAVAAGNVETSTRIVDVILGALSQAVPELIPAASHGSMNNVAMGSVEDGWDYYETIGGGMGASMLSDGLSAVQTHMTNTLNTPVESLEMHYPLRIRRYGVRSGSGGHGHHKGGDGIVREYEFLKLTTFTLLTERRRYAPWGSAGGSDGAVGVNRLNGEILPGKYTGAAEPGDVLTIETPGAGGYGSG